LTKKYTIVQYNLGGLIVFNCHYLSFTHTHTLNSANQTGIPKWLLRLGCIDPEDRFFYFIQKYEGIVTVLQVLAFIIILLYFVTSYDSAALVMSSISNNGDENPPLIQRFFWCITIGKMLFI